jgi:RNase P subunit RPR2
MNLKHLTDSTLLADTKSLVRQEQALLTKILWHLKEVDGRRLYSELKYGSLFDYCTKELGYSESSAQRRIIAARALADFPEIAPKIQSGELTLATVALVVSEFKTPSEKREMFVKVEGLSRTKAVALIDDMKDRPKSYTVTMDEETFKLWQEMQHLGVDLTKVVAQAKKTKLNTPIKREVFQRDRVCQQCGSIHRLEIDHRKPKGLGGIYTVTNLRILCRSCNQRKRIAAGLLRSGAKMSGLKVAKSFDTDSKGFRHSQRESFAGDPVIATSYEIARPSDKGR